MDNSKKVFILFIWMMYFSTGNVCVFSADEDKLAESRSLANEGKYKEAYEKLIKIADDMQAEIKNQKGLIEYYKEEAGKSGSPKIVMDHAYNESANALWASAYSLQHDGIFKKTGKEKEEYLQRAADTYKRIVIDYPFSNKAEDAQYHVGKIYYKYIRDNKMAENELQKYLNMYPNGRYAAEAAEMLQNVRHK